LIKRSRGPNAYELQLPHGTKIHPVFNVSVLEPADPSTPLQDTLDFDEEGEPVYEVEDLLWEDNQHILIKWKGYPHSENTWEPRTELRHLKLLEKFDKTKHKRKLVTQHIAESPRFQNNAGVPPYNLAKPPKKRTKQLNVLELAPTERLCYRSCCDQLPQGVTVTHKERTDNHMPNELRINEKEYRRQDFCICGNHEETPAQRRQRATKSLQQATKEQAQGRKGYN
jgi:hypothetical protein